MAGETMGAVGQCKCTHRRLYSQVSGCGMGEGYAVRRVHKADFNLADKNNLEKLIKITDLEKT